MGSDRRGWAGRSAFGNLETSDSIAPGLGYAAELNIACITARWVAIQFVESIHVCTLDTCTT